MSAKKKEPQLQEVLHISFFPHTRNGNFLLYLREKKKDLYVKVNGLLYYLQYCLLQLFSVGTFAFVAVLFLLSLIKICC